MPHASAAVTLAVDAWMSERYIPRYDEASLQGYAPGTFGRLIHENVVGRVQELKQEDGLDIWLCGGGKLAAELLPLIDKMLVKIHPVVFGRGIPLFDGKVDITKFKRTDARLFESGVSFMTYERP